MTDTDKLKRLARWFYIRATPDNPWEGQYIEASQAILALIAENEALEEDVGKNWDIAVSAIAQRDEAVALLRDVERQLQFLHGFNQVRGRNKITRFLARIDAAE